MDATLITTAVLIAIVGGLHSGIGEAFLIGPLCRRDDLPVLAGGAGLAAHTLRFAWHLTTVAWIGFSMILVLAAGGHLDLRNALWVVAVTAAISGIVAALGSRLRHPSWIAFMLIAALVATSSPAQAETEIEVRAGVLSIDPAEAAGYTGLAVRFPIDETMAISADYLTSVGEADFTTRTPLFTGQPLTIQTVDMTQYGAHLDFTKRHGDWFGLVQVGAAYTKVGFGGTIVTDTAPAFGFEVGWRMLGLGWSHTELDDRDVDAITFLLRF